MERIWKKRGWHEVQIRYKMGKTTRLTSDSSMGNMQSMTKCMRVRGKEKSDKEQSKVAEAL